MRKKARRMNKLFIFDLGDVVISGGMDSKSVAEYLHLDEKKYEEEYEKYSLKLGNGEISEEEFFSHISSLFSIKINSNPFKECYFPETNIELLPLVDKLREKGYRCVIGSNTIKSHIEKIKELKENPLSHFDSLYYSYEMGLSKPDKEFFSYIVKKEGFADKTSSVYFFDDRRENGEGASLIGINYFQYNRAKHRETERYLSSFF